MGKTKISVTIDERTAKEIDDYFRSLVVQKAKSGEPIPNLSNIYEEVIKKGWEAARKERRK